MRAALPAWRISSCWDPTGECARVVIRERATDCCSAPCLTALAHPSIAAPPSPGPCRLVAPVTEYQSTQRSVYLPSLAGTNLTWTYWFNQTDLGQGGSRITVATPLTEFPLFKLTRPF